MRRRSAWFVYCTKVHIQIRAGYCSLRRWRIVYPCSSSLMKKPGFKKVNRPQFRFGFAQILPLSVMLAAWLSSPSVGETTTSAVLEAEQDLVLAGSPRLTLDARAGYYLHAADITANTLKTSGADPRSREIYNQTCAQLTVMLRSADGARLWNRTETIACRNATYRLRFADGSRQDGTWDPGYFDLLLTPSQVHEKVTHDEARINDWGGVLVGAYKPADPRKYFLQTTEVVLDLSDALTSGNNGLTANREAVSRSSNSTVVPHPSERCS